MIEQVTDLKSEVTDLYEVLRKLTTPLWSTITQFKHWTINDVVLHLYASDYAAIVAVRDEEEFQALRKDILAVRQAGMSMIEESRKRFAGLTGTRLLGAWVEQAGVLCDCLISKDPKSRIAWSGPNMSVQMFATARQMETWAHGQEIHDVLGLDRVATARLRNIAILGVKTFEWSFRNRGLTNPTQPPHVRLSAPNDETWMWNNPSETNYVDGYALEFCQVVTQVRNVADTQLTIRGEIAQQWMAVAQCFAGPPSDPPAPGTRFKVPQRALA